MKRVWKIFKLTTVLVLIMSHYGYGQNNAPEAYDDENYTDEEVPVSGNLADNDIEIDGDILTYSLVQGTPDGELVINSDGSYTYTPALHKYGFEFMLYQCCDPFGLCDTAELVMAVFDVNDAPLMVDDLATVEMNGTCSGNLKQNDTELENEPIYFTLLENASHGSFTLETNGNYTYTPNPDYLGFDQVLVMGCDPCTACDVSILSINVTVPNDPPMAQNDYKIVNEDQATSGTVATNDSDPEGDLLTFTLLSPPSHGNLVFNANGSYTYTSFQNYSGMDDAWYQVCDPTLHCDQAQITFEVIEINDAPVAVDDFISGSEDIVLAGSVAGNDIEPDNELLMFDVWTGPVHGVFEINILGSYTFVANPNWYGTDQVTYICIDPCGIYDFGVLSIVINPVNDIPVAINDFKNINEDGFAAGNVALNDTDADADAETLQFGVEANAQYGSFNLNTSGIYTYTPEPNWNGTETIVYTVTDGVGAFDSGILEIIVAPINDSPITVNDIFELPEDQNLFENVSANDIEVDGELLAFSLINNVTNGTLFFNSNGAFNYTPAADWFGTATFTYRATDVQGNQSDATATINVLPLNDIPEASNALFTGAEDNIVIGNLENYVSDVDDLSLTYSLVSAILNGSLIFDETGGFEFTPQSNWFGIETVTYRVTDAAGAFDEALLTISLSSVNDVPIAMEDEGSNNEDQPIIGAVSLNDFDPDNDILIYSLLVSPLNGQLSFGANGSYTFIPDLDWYGVTQAVYRCTDTGGSFDQANILFTVTPLNDIPVALDDSQNIAEDQSESGNVAINDYDVDNDVLQYSVITSAQHGFFLLNSDGSFTYTPELDYTGIDQVVYQVCDPSSDCDTAVLTINIGTSNDAPIAIGETHNVNEDETISNSVGSNDYDADGDLLTYSIITNALNGAFELLNNGQYNYTPFQDFYGDELVIYQVCDSQGACDEGQLTIHVNFVNDIPVAVNDQFETPEENMLVASVGANDTDADFEQPTYTLLSDAQHGSFLLQLNGQFIYLPEPDFNGTDQAIYQVCDPHNACSSATVIIDVSFVNDEPIAINDLFNSEEDQLLAGSVALNDFDSDAENLTYQLVGQPQTGELILQTNGSFVFTPFENIHGTGQGTYMACDAFGECDIATITIDIAPVNDMPFAAMDFASVLEDNSTQGTVADNDYDVDNDDLEFNLIGVANFGVILFNSDGSYEYIPEGNFYGIETVSYSVCDGSGSCDTSVLEIEIVSVNDNPIAVNDFETGQEDLQLAGSVALNDSDPENNSLNYQTDFTSQNGEFTLSSDGSFQFNPNFNYYGFEIIEYTVYDSEGGSSVAELTLEIAPVNDAPIAVNDIANTSINISVQSSVASNDFDYDSELLNYTLIDGPENGTIEWNGDGSYTFVPELNFIGTVSVTYTVCDDLNACESGLLTLVVNPVNTAPSASDVFDFTCENVQLSIYLSEFMNDEDSDDADMAIAIISTSSGVALVDEGNPGIIFTPENDFTGEVIIDFIICDDGFPQLCDAGQIFVTVNPSLIPVVQIVSIAGELCFGDSNGMIDITVSGAGDEYTYQWSNDTSDQDLQNVTAGEYTLTVTGNATCNLPHEEVMLVPGPTAPLSIDGLAADPIDETSGGSTSYTVSGGTEPYTYEWTDENGETISEDMILGPFTDDAFIGNYTLSVNDENGCAISQTISVTDIPETSTPIGISITPNPSNGLFTLNVSGATGQNLTYRVSDIQGRLVSEKNLGIISDNVGNYQLDISSLVQGVYLFELIAGEQLHCIRLVKE